MTFVASRGSRNGRVRPAILVFSTSNTANEPMVIFHTIQYNFFKTKMSRL